MAPVPALHWLFQEQVRRDVGQAVYLLGWLHCDAIHRKRPVTYKWISQMTGFPQRTLEGWLHTLRDAGYCRIEPAWNGLNIRLRIYFSATTVESDFEEVNGAFWHKRAHESSEVYDTRHFTGRDSNQGFESTNAFRDANPEFVVETRHGTRMRERLKDPQ